MKHKILVPTLATALIAAGLSVSSLRAQQNGSTQTQRNAVTANSNISAASSAIAGSNTSGSFVQTAINDGLTLANSPAGLNGTSVPAAAVIGLDQIAKLQAEATWGMTALPLPNYLRNAELGLAPNQGWLVTQLIPGLAAANSGVEVGTLIVEIDGAPALNNQPLPMLQAEHKLLVMTEAGLKEICIKPMAELLLGTNPALDLLRQSNAFAQVVPQLGAIGLGNFPTAAISSQTAPRSLAVSQVNGEISISAIVNGPKGPRRVELRGSRAEIAQQLSDLPAEVQSQLAPHLGL